MLATFSLRRLGLAGFTGLVAGTLIGVAPRTARADPMLEYKCYGTSECVTGFWTCTVYCDTRCSCTNS